MTKGNISLARKRRLGRLSDLIQAAVGFDVDRGDRVTVETMRFMPDAATGTSADVESGPFSQLSIIWISIGAGAVLLLGGFTIMRMRRNRQSGRGQAGQSGAALALTSSDARLGLVSPQPNGQLAALTAGSDGAGGTPALSFGRPELGQQALLAGLFEIVDARPEEAVATLRSWLAGNA